MAHNDQKHTKLKDVCAHDYIYHLAPKYAKNIPKHVETGLKCVGDWDTLNRYQNCRKGAYCGLRFCESCRQRAAKGLENRFRRHYWNVLNGDETLARQRLRYVTFLSELVTNDQDDLNAGMGRMRKHVKKLKRKFSDIWIEGNIELEPIDLCYVQGAFGKGIRKKIQLTLCVQKIYRIITLSMNQKNTSFFCIITQLWILGHMILIVFKRSTEKCQKHISGNGIFKN